MAEAKKEAVKDFHSSLEKVLKSLEKKEFNYTDTVKISFTEDYAGFKKGEDAELGKLTGLAYVEMGVAKKS